MILYATNISTGGGKVLLDELILKQPFGKPTILFLDERYQFPTEANSQNFQIYRVKPTLTHRIASEFKLRRVSSEHPDKKVLSFGNLPPAFRLKSKTIVYLQNAFLLPNVPKPKDSLKLILRNLYERAWFTLFIGNSDEVWVQTQWMKNALPNKLKNKAQVRAIVPSFPPLISSSAKTVDFISITGTLKYKNLIPLLMAIEQSNITDKKFAIISDSRSLEIDQLLERIKLKNIKLDYYTNLKREEVYQLLLSSKCLIITSTIESFCLPLHEALHYKLDVIAGAYDFVTEYTLPKVTISTPSLEGIKEALKSYALKF